MSEPGADPPSDNQLFEVAAAWFARMRGPSADVSRTEFEAWLARGAAEREAYNRAAEVFAMGKLLGDDERADSDGFEPISKRRSVGVLLALFLVVGGTALAVYLTQFQSTPTSALQVAQLETGRLERRSVRLTDGSVVTLDADTRLEARFNPGSRTVKLLHGAARFHVAHRVTPFVVHAGGGTVTALGTIFDVVVVDERRISVRLLQGLVDVRLPNVSAQDRGSSRVRRLRPGQALQFRPRETPGERSKVSATATVLEGSDGFEGVPLAEVLTRANHQGSRPIRLADENLAELRVSGRVQAKDPEELADAIALLFDLLVDRTDPRMLVLRRK